MDIVFQVHDIGNNSKPSSLLQFFLYDDEKKKYLENLKPYTKIFSFKPLIYTLN